jgi:Negative regulator of sigma F
MSCDDLDRLRTRSGGCSSSSWPREARQHLESCQRCSQLQAVLDSSVDTYFPEALRDRIEGAILPGLNPVCPLPSALRVAVTLLFCSVVVIAAANWRLGLAGWRARGSLQASVDFSLLAISVLVLANILAHQMAPGYRRRLAAGLYLGVPLLSLLAADVLLFGYRWNPAFAPLALSCWGIGVTCAAVSAPLFWLALRRGFSLDSVSHGATAGLLAGLVGVTVLEIYCPYLDRLHISVAHIGAAVTSALVGAALGGIKSRIERRAA